MFVIVLICVLIGDLCLVVMDDDEDVVCIEAPAPPNARTSRRARQVALDGRAVRVRFNGVGSKSASSPVRAEKFKKQRRAERGYVLQKEWKVVCSYPTGCCTILDAEDIEFAMYKRASNV